MKTTPRLLVEERLEARREVPLSREQGHYLTGVLRLAGGDPVRIFNTRDGEWLAHIAGANRKSVSLRCERHIADVQVPPDVDYVFAPLKHARLDYVVQKATELGARRLVPVITQRTIAERVNMDRMRANVAEAAEQCNLVFVPEVLDPRKLELAIRDWDPVRRLVYCDETAANRNPLAALKTLSAPAAVLIGPEGGFSTEEKAMLQGLHYVMPISLGPRIMRADTAAVAALTLVQSVLGDWGDPSG